MSRYKSNNRRSSTTLTPARDDRWLMISCASRRTPGMTAEKASMVKGLANPARRLIEKPQLAYSVVADRVWDRAAEFPPAELG